MEIQELVRINNELRLENLELKTQLEQFKRMLFGAKSERFIPSSTGQLNLFEAAVDSPAVEEGQAEQVTIEKHTRTKLKHKGRSLIAGLSHLPVTEVEIEVPHSENSTCIGTVERTTLAYKPGRFYIHKEIAKKYKEVETGKITAVNFPAQPIDKCEAHITLLVYICIAKFVDHLPEYRQQQIFKREKVNIPPSTMNGWVHKCADLIRPMGAFIGTKILSSGNIMIDESTIRVMAGKKNKTHTGYMWVIYSPALRCVQFIYHHGRTHDIPINLLKDYTGKYQTDGYEAYESLDKVNKKVNHALCNAHARRYFEKALTNNKAMADYALQVYQDIYQVEANIKAYLEENGQMSQEQFYAYRVEQRKELIPILGQYKEWLNKSAREVLPSSSIAKAINYVLKRWEKLTKYVTDGELEIDTNRIENVIRPLALGRKNYLFAGNSEAAANIAVFQTIFGTCKHMNINPAEYLTWYLENIAQTTINNIHTLSPWEFKKKMEKKDM